MEKQDELKPDSKGCFAKAKDDEMLFILRAQDQTSPIVILHWMQMNFWTCPEAKLREAFECAMKMRAYPDTKVAD